MSHEKVSDTYKSLPYKEEIMKSGHKGIILLGLVLALSLASTALAQDQYPSKPINVVVGYPPGGIMDIQVRSAIPRLSKELGQNAVMVNKPGAGSTLAVNYVAKSRPDGYTIMNVGFIGVVSAPYMYHIDWGVEDFTYFIGHSTFNFAICVRADAPWKTFQEWVEHVQKNPGFKYGTYGQLTPVHVFIEWMGKQLGLKLVHIPYTGGAPGLTALMGGHIDIYGSAGSHVPYIKQGKLRTLLEIKGKIPDPAGVKVQTVSEIFKNAPLDIIDLPIGYLGPKNLPSAIRAKLTDAIKKSTTDNPEFIKANEMINVDVEYMSPEDVLKSVKKGYASFGTLLKELNLVKEIKKEKVQ